MPYPLDALTSRAEGWGLTDPMAIVLALIPARTGSKGIPRKNTRPLGGGPCITWLACEVAVRASVPPYVSSDWGVPVHPCAEWIQRPFELAHDDTPMISVVKHALEQIPGPEDQIIVLLQPTQPLRKPEHITRAIDLLRSSGADSVVSVVEIPKTHHARFQLAIGPTGSLTAPDHAWGALPVNRQDVRPAYRRDGTVYAFWRRTVTDFGTIYGEDCRPLIIDPDDSCELDTEADWADLERRWRARCSA